MKRFWRFMVDLSSRREDGTTLAVFRILVAAIIAYSLVSIASAGLVEALWVDRAYGGMQRLYANVVMAALGGATPGTVWWLVGVAAGATVCLGLGIYGRVSAFVLLQSYYALYISNGLATGGYDMLISNALWLLVLGDSTATLSVDCRRRHGRWSSDDLVAAWPRYALIWQLALVYGFTGIQKLGGPWLPGNGYTALYYVMHDPTWMRFDGTFVASIVPVAQFSTALSWHWEHAGFLLPLVFWFRATSDRRGRVRAAFNRFDLRKPWSLIGITMHLGIIFMLNVGPFSLISMAYYVALWTPGEVRRVLTRS
ncbi:MAG: hypothetical protein DRJ42_10475 [Deltaproteobacteria bacterium]|nr:MAG: hypothetical protein DRJ42_10475 [Deltaproteobacteria bacterium]